jgi:hypothetical protein
MQKGLIRKDVEIDRRIRTGRVDSVRAHDGMSCWVDDASRTPRCDCSGSQGRVRRRVRAREIRAGRRVATERKRNGPPWRRRGMEMRKRERGDERVHRLRMLHILRGCLLSCGLRQNWLAQATIFHSCLDCELTAFSVRSLRDPRALAQAQPSSCTSRQFDALFHFFEFCSFNFSIDREILSVGLDREVAIRGGIASCSFSSAELVHMFTRTALAKSSSTTPRKK